MTTLRRFIFLVNRFVASQSLDILTMRGFVLPAILSLTMDMGAAMKPMITIAHDHES